jgi:hypothetical protein
VPGGPLVCPGCGALEGSESRLCEHCGTPLVLAGSAAKPPHPDPLRRRALKVRPEYASGDLVRVAGGRNQTEAEFVAGLLLEEGIPSLVRRSAGFDVPDYMAAGPRDVLVPASGAEAAREVLLEGGLAPAGSAPPPRATRILVVLLLGLALIAALLWAGASAG